MEQSLFYSTISDKESGLAVSNTEEMYRIQTHKFFLFLHYYQNTVL